MEEISGNKPIPGRHHDWATAKCLMAPLHDVEGVNEHDHRPNSIQTVENYLVLYNL